MRETGTPIDEPNWRRGETYGYTRALPRRGWAWEFVRRNRDYWRAWSETSDAVAVRKAEAHLTVLTAGSDLRDMRRWGILLADPPQQRATDAVVFWDPRTCRHVLPVAAVPAAVRHGAAPFHLPGVCCPATLLLTPDRSQHLVFHDAGRALQLVARGASLLTPIRLLTDAVLEPRRVHDRLSALECLNQLIVSGRFPDGLAPQTRSERRLRIVLQALDGWLAGAPYRDIGAAVFGEARVRTDWADPRNYLRDQVRRAIRRGRFLMAGGYRRFLE